MPKRTRELEPAEDEAGEDLRSRGDTRRARSEVEEALARLAQELVELTPSRLEKLGLAEALQNAVLDARTIGSPIARTRQLRLVRSELRHDDWAAVRVRLDALVRHGTTAGVVSPQASRAEEWVVRLLGEGTAAIEALIQECKTADRTHLWTLIRQARKAVGDRRKKAEQRLAQTVSSLLRSREP
jgi:ribosomal 50S subunit-associated protein YjgA (DUF615 family)